MRDIQGFELKRDAHWSQNVNRLASSVAEKLGTVAIGGTIRFPNPNELKKRAPRLTEAEFDEHKLAVAGLAGWVFSRVPINTPRRRGRGHPDLPQLHLH